MRCTSRNKSSIILRTAIFLSFLLINLIHPSFSGDTLSPNKPLSDGQTLVSAGGTFALGFFSPTNNSKNRYVGIWYNNIPVQTLVWVANRGQPVPEASTGVLTFNTNGTLVITTIENSTTILWSSAPMSMKNNSSVAQLLDNGNFVVRHSDVEAAKYVAWQSFDHPTDTLLPGMKLGWDLTTGLNHNLTSWKSTNEPSPGDYTLSMDIRGDPQLVASFGSVRKSRSGPWTGLSFDIIPEMVSYSQTGFSFDFVNNNKEIYYSYEISNRSTLTRLVMNQTGKIERYVWLDQSGWIMFWYTPRTQCAMIDSCGPNGVCSLFTSPMCSCLQGFKPKSPGDWGLMDGSQGCVRKQPLDCQKNRTDGFLKMTAAQLPDTWSSFVDRSMDLEECRARCLMNCSCTAYTNADVRDGGSGCIHWFQDLSGLGQFDSGQTLYVRLAASEFASSSNKSKKGVSIAIVVVITAISTLLLLACTAYCQWRKKIRVHADITHHHEHESEMREEDLQLPLFDLSLIHEATNNFAPENKLGQGGFGPVYMGKLRDGLEIAVKRLSKTSKQGIDEFKNEVMLIKKLQHRNLVRLLGCCIQMEERMLIYEYMPNKSLDAFLFDREKIALLDWQTRHQVILGVARGLLYLHQESRVTIIHRDLKAGNILLDETMNPKISDFGLARIFEGDESTTKTRKVVGTYGYMAPEYAMDGVYSVKSDVFSYGVLVLEIISGQRNKGVYISDPDICLLSKVWSLWNEGQISDLTDTSMAPYSYSVTQVMRCIRIGLLCVQENPRDRPTMSSVIFMLGTDNVVLPQPKQPGFLGTRDTYRSLPSNNQEPSNAIDETLSIIDGR